MEAAGDSSCADGYGEGPGGYGAGAAPGGYGGGCAIVELKFWDRRCR